jgi:hypothetical protein
VTGNGVCVREPATCPPVRAQPCGCNDVTYENSYLLEQALAAKAYDGECVVQDSRLREGTWGGIGIRMVVTAEGAKSCILAHDEALSSLQYCVNEKTVLFMALNWFYVPSVSCLVTFGELERYRFLVEAFAWIMGVCVAQEILASRRVRQLLLLGGGCANVGRHE